MAQTLPNGVVVPNADGQEQISATGIQEMRTLGASVDALLATKAGAGYVDSLVETARWARGRLQTGGDAFTLTPGVYTVGSLLDASQIANLPEEWPGTLIVEGNPGQGVRAIRFIPYQRDYSWETASNDLSGGFMPWRKSSDTGVAPYAQHAIRQSQMMYDVGPVDTGGLGAVAWRIDHGLTNFRDQMLPIFRAAGIVPMLTLNSRDWDRAENAGVTQSEVNGWVANGWVEISNHGATHSNAVGEGNIHDFIVGGLAELETQLPAARGKIYGFCIPGVGVSDAFDGFAGGNRPEQWDTYAGRLILQHHAVGYGHLAGMNPRILDGTPRDGMLHMATDTRTSAQMIAAIDDAITQRKGLQIMSHPSNLGTAGYHSAATVQVIVNHIVAKRDAGELAVLSSYQMMIADATNPPAPAPYFSGVRDVASLITTGTAQWARLVRSGDLVELHVQNWDRQGAPSNSVVMTLPPGFRPAWTRRLTSSSSTGYPYTGTSGTVQYNGEPGTTIVYGSWITPDAPPTTPPGTPA